MGVKDFYTFAGLTDQANNMSELGGRTIGVDTSILLHQAVSSKSGSEARTSVPPLPVAAVTARIDTVLALTTKNKIVTIWVFDGARHKVKNDESKGWRG
jgi:hypothetical protein